MVVAGPVSSITCVLAIGLGSFFPNFHKVQQESQPSKTSDGSDGRGNEKTRLDQELPSSAHTISGMQTFPSKNFAAADLAEGPLATAQATNESASEEKFHVVSSDRFHTDDQMSLGEAVLRAALFVARLIGKVHLAAWQVVARKLKDMVAIVELSAGSTTALGEVAHLALAVGALLATATLMLFRALCCRARAQRTTKAHNVELKPLIPKADEDVLGAQTSPFVRSVPSPARQRVKMVQVQPAASIDLPVCEEEEAQEAADDCVAADESSSAEELEIPAARKQARLRRAGSDLSAMLQPSRTACEEGHSEPDQSRTPLAELETEVVAPSLPPSSQLDKTLEVEAALRSAKKFIGRSSRRSAAAAMRGAASAAAAGRASAAAAAVRTRSAAATAAATALQPVALLKAPARSLCATRSLQSEGSSTRPADPDSPSSAEGAN